VDLADHDVTHALRSPTSLELAVQRGFLGPLRTANTHDNFKRKDIFPKRSGIFPKKQPDCLKQRMLFCKKLPI